MNDLHNYYCCLFLFTGIYKAIYTNINFSDYMLFLFVLWIYLQNIIKEVTVTLTDCESDSDRKVLVFDRDFRSGY